MQSRKIKRDLHTLWDVTSVPFVNGVPVMFDTDVRCASYAPLLAPLLRQVTCVIHSHGPQQVWVPLLRIRNRLEQIKLGLGSVG